MGWNISWLFSGGFAFLLVIINICRSFTKNNKGWQALLFASLSFGVLAVLDEYRMVDEWITWGNHAALEDVVPSMVGTLTTAVNFGIGLNLVALVSNLRKDMRK